MITAKAGTSSASLAVVTWTTNKNSCSTPALRRSRDLREAKASLLFFCLGLRCPGALGRVSTPRRGPGQPRDSEALPEAGGPGHPTHEHSPSWPGSCPGVPDRTNVHTPLVPGPARLRSTPRPGGRTQLQDLEPRAAGALKEAARACPTVPGCWCRGWPGRAPPGTAVVPVPMPDPALWAELPSWAVRSLYSGHTPLNGALIPRNHVWADL